MQTLTWSDIDSYIDTPVPKVNKSKYIILAWVIETPLVKYLVFKRTLYFLNNIYKKLDSTLKDYKANKLDISNPEDIRNHMKLFITQFSDLRDEFLKLDYFTKKQTDILKISLSDIIKKMIKLEAIAIKESNKDKPKIDDSDLINLVMNNNSIELGKTILSK